MLRRTPKLRPRPLLAREKKRLKELLENLLSLVVTRASSA
jgi:hypothetical protein